jgi:hypothetical protein
MNFRLILFIGVLTLTSCIHKAPGSAVSTQVEESVVPEHNPSIVSSTALSSIAQIPGAQIGTIQSSCLNVAPQLSQDIDIRGKILLSHRHDLSWFNGTNRETRSLVKNMDREYAYAFDPAVSPDGKWWAYITGRGEFQKRWIVIEPADSKIDTGVDDPRVIRIAVTWSEGIFIHSWLDPNHLVLIRQAKPIYSTLILNPFTGEENEYRLETFENYPEMMDATRVYFQSSNLMPDPTQQMVAYPQYDGGFFITLWDLQSKKALAKLKDLEKFKHNPLWAADGKDFVIAVNTKRDDDAKIRTHDWFQMSRDGTVRRLTDFAPFFSTALSWVASRSPNDRYLAFELLYIQSGQDFTKWLVMDLKTGKLLNFCIDSVQGDSMNPVWSPDSRFMLLGRVDDEDNGTVILVDLLKSQAYQIAKDQMPVGWTVQQ